MDNSMKFPDGAPLVREIAEEDIKETISVSLHKMLGISPQREEDLQKVCDIALINGREKNATRTDKVLFEVASKCKTLNELAVGMFMVGVTLTRKYNKGMGGLGPIIMALGGMGFPGSGRGDNAGDGEDPSIEELIRRSKKINRRRGEDENNDGF